MAFQVRNLIWSLSGKQEWETRHAEGEREKNESVATHRVNPGERQGERVAGEGENDIIQGWLGSKKDSAISLILSQLNVEWNRLWSTMKKLLGGHAQGPFSWVHTQFLWVFALAIQGLQLFLNLEELLWQAILLGTLLFFLHQYLGQTTSCNGVIKGYSISHFTFKKTTSVFAAEASSGPKA